VGMVGEREDGGDGNAVKSTGMSGCYGVSGDADGNRGMG
jgi:hypothetical protein